MGCEVKISHYLAGKKVSFQTLVGAQILSWPQGGVSTGEGYTHGDLENGPLEEHTIARGMIQAF